MTAPRSIREFYKYHGRPKEEGCPFCVIDDGHPQYVEEGAFVRVIRNRYPYSIWDGEGVVDHLMIVPKQHVDRLSKLGPKAALEYMQVIQKYEDAGYNLYARVPESKVKTIAHQHSHLIKSDSRARWFLLLLRRPFYIRLSR